MNNNTDVLFEKIRDEKEGPVLCFSIKKEANNPFYLKMDHDLDDELVLIRSTN